MKQIEHIVFFDGKCNLCNRSVDALINKKKDNTLYFASLQSEFAAAFLPTNRVDLNDLDTLYYYSKGRLYNRSSALLQVSARLKGGFPLLKVLFLVPRFIRDAAYTLVARNRYRLFGKKDTCRLATEEEKTFFLETREDFTQNEFLGRECLLEENRGVPSLVFTVLLVTFLIAPYFIYIRYGAEMEPYPAVILPSGAGFAYRDSSQLSYEYAYLYGQDENGEWEYLNPEEFLFPMPSYYIGHVMTHISWLDEPPVNNDVAGTLRTWMFNNGWIRLPFRIEESEEFKRWLSDKLIAHAFDSRQIRIERHRVIQELEGDMFVRDSIYAIQDISLE